MSPFLWGVESCTIYIFIWYPYSTEQNTTLPFPLCFAFYCDGIDSFVFHSLRYREYKKGILFSTDHFKIPNSNSFEKLTVQIILVRIGIYCNFYSFNVKEKQFNDGIRVQAYC